jgi:hypothetical protein
MGAARGFRRLVVVPLVLAVAACSGPIDSTATSGPTMPASSPALTFSSTASPEPSASLAAPSSAPATPPTAISSQVFPPGAAIEVAVRELNVRRKPTTSSKRLETLRRGDVMIISPTDQLSFGWGPVKADGYTWYAVMRPNVVDTGLSLDPLPKPPIDVADGPPFWGWLATDDGTTPYVTAIGPRCPTTVDLLNVSGMLPAERLACFNEPFVLQGTYGCAGCGAVELGSFKPAWLATPVELDFLSANPAERLGPLALRFAPKGPPRPAHGSIVRVTVHVDDARSDNCAMSELVGEELVPIDDRTAMLYCRERLVVDSYEVLGLDPSFPG